ATAAPELLNLLRALGYSPAPDRDGMPVLGGADRTPAGTAEGATRTQRGAPPSFAVTTNPWQLTDEDLQTQLEVLRGAASGGKAVEAEPLLALEALHRAIRLKKRVRMGIVDPHGNHRREILQPLSVGGGRLRVADPDHGNERVVPIHRVMDIELVEEAGPEKEQPHG
ncbi:hypothetical protein D477_005636, partial [Arthrobacter crystallopoietes BAB-32]